MRHIIGRTFAACVILGSLTMYATGLAAERQQRVAQGVSPGLKRQEEQANVDLQTMHAEHSRISPVVRPISPGSRPRLHSAAAPRQSQSSTQGMLLIGAGDFWMGRVHFFPVDSVALFERDRQDDYPAHKVAVDSFYLDKYEVTNEDYAPFVAATGRRTPWHWKDGKIPKGEERFPVYNVNWDEAQAYCQSKGKRLPTEAEWEKAARGGLDRQAFPWGDLGSGPPSEHANVTSLGPVAVGSFPPNNYGLYDMVGNVWEWVQDWYERNYYSVSPRRNPSGPESGMYKVIRGGGWSDNLDKNLMNHFRNFQDPEQRVSTLGFRCAK